MRKTSAYFAQAELDQPVQAQPVQAMIASSAVRASRQGLDALAIINSHESPTSPPGNPKNYKSAEVVLAAFFPAPAPDPPHDVPAGADRQGTEQQCHAAHERRGAEHGEGYGKDYFQQFTHSGRSLFADLNLPARLPFMVYPKTVAVERGSAPVPGGGPEANCDDSSQLDGCDCGDGRLHRAARRAEGASPLRSRE